jgi:DNA processing protein
LRLALAPGLAGRAVLRALEAAGGPLEALGRPWAWWQGFVGVRPEQPARAHPARVDPRPVLRRAEELGVEVLTPADPGWPAAALAGLYEPPRVLFLRGRLPGAAQPCAALVGTRSASPYGLRVARELAEGLSRRGVCVVSGMAVGVDAAAHAGALAAAGPAPRTLAVLASGLAIPYPSENLALREDIARHGGVLSEQPPDTTPERWHFLHRNRLVAALAQAVVVVEAPLRSGALHTAAQALQLGREVLAVPGPIGRITHEGVNRLLREQQAGVCTGPEDVLRVLGVHGGGAAPRVEVEPPPPGPQLTLWRLLDPDEARDADSLCRASALPPADVAVALGALELQGRAVRIPGVGYLRS